MSGGRDNSERLAAQGSARGAASVSGAPVETDGRRRRTEDSRARIVAAMLELVRTGHVWPSAEQVAAQAQVGLRTVFRHFDDMESLYGEMATVIEAELRAMADRPFMAADWRGRLFELIARRGAAFEAIAPFMRAADAHRHRSLFLRESLQRLAAAQRAILLGLLPAPIAGDIPILEALDLLLSYEAWSRLRREQHLSPQAARAALEAALARLIR